MKLGIDIDNTILDYSSSFVKHANILFESSLPEGSSKIQVQNHVVMNKGEPSWTQLQGVVYSQTPLEAIVSEGFKEFLDYGRLMSATVMFVSHKTKFPIVGPKVDLREPVLDLLRREGLLNPALQGKDVVFCDSTEEKLEVIATREFDFFIDDLASIIAKLPNNLQGLHYKCECPPSINARHQPMRNWSQIRAHVFGETPDD
jgi:hypothetical protein